MPPKDTNVMHKSNAPHLLHIFICSCLVRSLVIQNASHASEHLKYMKCIEYEIERANTHKRHIILLSLWLDKKIEE